VAPHIKNRLTSEVGIGTGFDQVHLPTAGLDWTGAPRIELGYRFSDDGGEFLLAYRSLVSEGTDFILGFDTPDSAGFLKSRLNVNVLDIDFSSHECCLGSGWDMKWKIGARLASVFFDSRAFGSFLEQRTSNDFRGAGPHLGLDLWRQIDGTYLAWFGRVETAAVLGNIKQSYEESVAQAGNTVIGGAVTDRHTQTVPVLNLQTGLSWTPPGSRCLRFAAGYHFETWWYLGEVNNSHATLTDQGVFFRAELGF
jgi:hypothetical protein